MTQKKAYDHLRPKQLEAVIKAEKSDCLVMLRTGYGKTLVFELLPYVTNSVIVVVCPLDIIIEQLLQSFGTSAVQVSSECDQLNQLQNFMYLIGHPEQLVTPQVQATIRKLGKKISHIVVDEGHCISFWGSGPAPFRSAFGQLRSLRSQVPSAKVVVLTATATLATQKCIIESLLMGQYFKLEIVESDPDRSGVYLAVKRRLPTTGKHDSVDSYYNILIPLFGELQNNPSIFLKTVIYMPLAWCGQAHKLALETLPTAMHAKIAQYHSPQTKDMKKAIAAGLCDGNILLVFATEALGMGADVKDIRRIIHITSPASVETYMQELGR